MITYQSKGRSVMNVMVWVFFVQFGVFKWFFMTDFHWTAGKVGERSGMEKGKEGKEKNVEKYIERSIHQKKKKKGKRGARRSGKMVMVLCQFTTLGW